MRAAKLLHAHGAPAYRLERMLERMAGHLGLPGQFLCTPTSLWCAFDDEDGQRTHLARLEPGEVDLGRLIEIDELLEDLEDGRTGVAVARERLEALAGAPPRYGWGSVSAAFAAVSGTAAVLFGGGGREVVAAALVGGALALLGRLARASQEVSRVFEPLAAFLAAALALAIGRAVALDDRIVTLSALIVLIPGLGVTVAMLELATRHWVSGTARFAGAVTVLLTIAFGVAMGRTLLGAGDPAPVTPLPAWVEWLAVAVSPFGFAVLLQARGRELGWIFAAGLAGIVGTRVGGAQLGIELAPFVGAVLVGLVSNVYARVLDRPASVPLTPGILLLVPGSLGYRALDSFLARDATAGMEMGFRMVMVATALVAGLSVANLVLPPRRSL